MIINAYNNVYIQILSYHDSHTILQEGIGTYLDP